MLPMPGNALGTFFNGFRHGLNMAVNAMMLHLGMVIVGVPSSVPGMLQVKETAPRRNCHRVRAISGAEFAHDALEMDLDGLLGNE
jgi:hypothetical protein